MTCTRTHLTPVPNASVRINDSLLSPRIETNRTVTMATEYRLCKETGRLDAFDWRPGLPTPPHIFWDSDVAKWIEAGAYVLEKHADPVLEEQIDTYVSSLVAAQDADGYANSHFLKVEPEKRWMNLRDNHELYCAGHLMEAAVAYYRATGKRMLLEAMCRYADYIANVFGPAPEQRHGYPGHEEIELGLVKLYAATNTSRYLKLASYFIDERGKPPCYFEHEAGRTPGERRPPGGMGYYQAHLPVREQTTAVGHAVRACYLYCGMADVARETHDETLMQACRAVWRNIVNRRMYITGGVGSSHAGERFTYDYDLPNEAAYAETCAAISLFFFAHRMLRSELKGEYGDIMERTLYNGILSGVSLDGMKFFYVNPLAQHPQESRDRNWSVGRQAWFGCACCPPNIARLLASLGEYVYLTTDSTLAVNLYVGGTATAMVAETPVTIETIGNYPFHGTVNLCLSPETPLAFTLALRIPGWCCDAKLAVNGASIESKVIDGFAMITRTWLAHDRVELVLAMPVERVHAHPAVRQNCGRVALQRGPVVYCLEEVDNGMNLEQASLSRAGDVKLADGEGPLTGLPCLKARGHRYAAPDPASDGPLYHHYEGPESEEVELTAVPYFAWANRGDGEMQVWVRER